MEKRFLKAEMRMDGEGRIEGYAAVFNVWADLGWFREQVLPGAFSKTIQEADIRALFNHDVNFVLGRNRSGTLELAEDTKGLHFRVTPPDTQTARDLVIEPMRRGDIDGASFMFDTIREEWSGDETARARSLVEARLYDVSVVTFPAYPQATVTARSLARSVLSAAREAGLGAEALSELVRELEQFAPEQFAPEQFAPAAPVEVGHPADVERRLALMRRRLELAGK